MKATSAAAVLTAAAVMMGTGTSVAASGRVLVDTSPFHNRHWTTVYTNEVPLRWEWKADATYAELDIVGMNGTVTTNFTTAVSNWVWQAFASSLPSAEDVYDLTLTFYKSGNAVVGALTSRLAVVTGAFGKTAVDPGPSDMKWAKVKENVVIPYDAGWTEATDGATDSLLVIAKTGGATQTNALADVCGYDGWKLKHSRWEYGTFCLALTFPGTVTNAWDATLVRQADGTLVRMQ